MRTGITGGIGSGKSYVCRRLKALYGIEVYDCDTAAKRLMHHSTELRQQLTALIGPDAYLPQSATRTPLTSGLSPLNKRAVARFLLASESNARAIDAIVHQPCSATLSRAATNGWKAPFCLTQVPTGWLTAQS